MFNGINGMLFQQSLQDLVKGIRAHRRDEDEYIRTKLTEIGEECRKSDLTKKTTAVLKLTYLQMMGYSASFASFHIIEVMSNPDFTAKRIGYLAAAQSFSPATDVLLLTTNQFKKDLTNGKLQDCSQALTCLGKIITEELGRDLDSDVSLLLTSPRPYIRKKTLLVLYRLIMVHPDTLPVVSARFRERLTDSDPGVLCAAVTVTTELARAAPSTFLSLAPLLYQLLMNKESNNWMLIKIVKLMGVLTPLEPRLGKKLVEPLTTIMRTTRAKSLLYECCSTVTSGLLDHPEAVDLCAKRLAEFMEDTDQNLKYLGLLSMRRLIQAHPHLANDHRDNILDCLEDDDIGIRMRALELVSEFVTKRNLRDISRILLRKLRRASADGFLVDDALTAEGIDTIEETRAGLSASIDQEAPFRESLSKQLLRAGEYKRATSTFKGGYDLLSTADDFAWYLTTIVAGLSELPLLSNTVRAILADQLLELTSRVEAMRPISVKIAFSLLSLRIGNGGNNGVAGGGANSVTDGLGEDSSEAANDVDSDSNIEARGADHGLADTILSPTLAGSTAWILGEYAELIVDYVAVTNRLVHFPKRGLDSAAQVRILTACVKVLVASSNEQATAIYGAVREYVESLINSQFPEVQDRAWLFHALLAEFGSERRAELASLFSGKLIPVDARAQSKVPISNELDLETSLLDGSDSLITYLKRSVVDGKKDFEDEGGDEEKDLFQEAVFSSTSLSMNIGEVPGLAEEKTSSSAALNSSTGVIRSDATGNANTRISSPFYLNGSSMDGRGSQVAMAADEEMYEVSKYGLASEPLSSEAAVVVAEENPLGLSLSDDERSEQTQSKLESRLQEAFDRSGQASARESTVVKKDKKKKKKKVVAKTRAQESSLIDFDDNGTGKANTVAGKAAQPKHVADSLLM